MAEETVEAAQLVIRSRSSNPWRGHLWLPLIEDRSERDDAGVARVRRLAEAWRALRAGRDLAQERQLVRGLGVPVQDPESDWLRFLKGLEAEDARWQRLRAEYGDGPEAGLPPPWMLGRGRLHD